MAPWPPLICCPYFLAAFILAHNVVVFALLASMPRSLGYATLFADVAMFTLIAILLPPAALAGFVLFAPLKLSAYVLAVGRSIKMGVVVLIISALLEARVIMDACSTAH